MISVPKPILCLMGGFLGAGKTSLVLRAARRLESIPLRTALVANDQGHDLVDALVAHDAERPVRLVNDGCFCCRFDAFVQELEALVGAVDPHLVFAEAVGSCADLSATVLNPLRRRMPDGYVFAPITVVAEPECVHDMLIEPSPRFSRDVRYLFQKQVEEADVLLLNKVEAYPEDVLAMCEAALRGVNGTAPVLRTSAVTGQGVDPWLRLLGRPQRVGSRILELDYDRYGAAELEMSWYDARIRVEGDGVDPEAFLRRFVGQAARALDEGGVCVHLKTFLAGPFGAVRANATMSNLDPAVHVSGDVSRGPWTLLVNVRALGEPKTVERRVRRDRKSVV